VIYFIECWLPVPGYEGLYEVSDLGRVWSVRRWCDASQPGLRRQCGGKFLSQGLRNGYPSVVLFQDGQRKPWNVHVLVAAAFIGPCPPGQEVRHGPAGKLDPSLPNICYGTRSQNHLDKRRDGTSRCGEENNKAVLTRQDVIDIRSRSTESTAVLARAYGVNWSTVDRVRKRQTWQHVA
jgi:NUMOD4 motif